MFFFLQPTAKKDKKKRRPKKGKSPAANTILHAAKNGSVDQCQSNSAIPTNSCLEQGEATCQEMMFWRSYARVRRTVLEYKDPFMAYSRPTLLGTSTLCTLIFHSHKHLGYFVRLCSISVILSQFLYRCCKT